MKQNRKLWWALKGASETRRTNGEPDIERVPEFRATNPGTPERRIAIREFARGVAAATIQIARERNAREMKHGLNTNHAQAALLISYDDVKVRIQDIAAYLVRLANRQDETTWADAGTMKHAGEVLQELEAFLGNDERMVDTTDRIAAAAAGVRDAFNNTKGCAR
jgi:hypothetical protein